MSLLEKLKEEFHDYLYLDKEFEVEKLSKDRMEELLSLFEKIRVLAKKDKSKEIINNFNSSTAKKIYDIKTKISKKITELDKANMWDETK